MGLEQSTIGQNCCLAIIQDLQKAGLAYHEIYIGNPRGLAVSILSKPDDSSDCDDFLRVKSVGTITCQGSVAQLIKQHSLARRDTLWEMGELLKFMGVPACHEEMYSRPLKSGQVVLVLQGEGKPLRQGCQILEDISLEKPVLYLV